MAQYKKIRIAALFIITLSISFCHDYVKASNSQPHNKVNTAKSTKYMIIVTGGELLSGIYPDGHTYFITRTLRPLGLECIGSMSVDDKKFVISKLVNQMGRILQKHILICPLTKLFQMQHLR